MIARLENACAQKINPIIKMAFVFLATHLESGMELIVSRAHRTQFITRKQKNVLAQLICHIMMEVNVSLVNQVRFGMPPLVNASSVQRTPLSTPTVNA